MSVIRNVRLDGNGLLLPTGALGDTDIGTPAAGVNAIGAAKLKTRHLIYKECYAIGTTIASATFYLGMVRQAATLVDIQAIVTGTLFTSTDNVTVDLKKSTGGGSYSTVLSSVITLNASSTLKVAQSTTFSGTSLAAGDSLEIVTADTGSSGLGLWVGVWLDENPSA